jgi:Flp pilus assembly pilin Flp
MFDPAPSDRRARGSVRRRIHTGVRRPRQDENGQAMVEFALILFPLLLLVAGIIQFGIALNFWLDMNRIANQGARQAVVNHWANCPRIPETPACTATTVGANNSLATYLRGQAISRGLRDSVCVFVTYPEDNDPATEPGSAGSPVRVTLESDFDLLPILGVGSLRLRGTATMRLEQDPTHISLPDAAGPAPCP